MSDIVALVVAFAALIGVAGVISALALLWCNRHAVRDWLQARREQCEKEQRAHQEKLAKQRQARAAATATRKAQLQATKAVANAPANKQHSVSSFAAASLALGIVGYLIIPLGFIPGIVGLIFGEIVLSRIKKNPELQGKGLAIAGVIVSGCSIVLSVMRLLERYAIP